MTEEFDRTIPVGAVNYFRNCIVSGDLQGTLSCFDKEAVYIDRDGTEIKGLDNIEKAMQHLCNWKPEIKGSKHRATIVGDLAIWVDNWSMKAKMPDGNPIEMKGATSCLMKQNEKGIWLWLVDNPFAAEIFEN
ncbi:ketosteroid isomerase-like protein [Flavobacterium sp. 90]|uniref:YybH family protein n=1 Tax=unclassified Flavobacterium TaxID=196869 RepID=UPI000F217E9B|nr:MULTISPECIES: nuclear transport factor 2 family protein [unclassified Flavobacterium]RKR08803.1 ketosteroid isomerase-like protein [Flavobacterium sp. 81]TCK52590.1 ketosteroid isomerase-like protein [Flavobacterium sp. 90]